MLGQPVRTDLGQSLSCWYSKVLLSQPRQRLGHGKSKRGIEEACRKISLRKLFFISQTSEFVKSVAEGTMPTRAMVDINCKKR